MVNVAVRAWSDTRAAAGLLERIRALDEAGGVLRVDVALMTDAVGIAAEHGLSAYDAAYVAAARRWRADLVSCDVRDLVSRGLASLPADPAAAAQDND